MAFLNNSTSEESEDGERERESESEGGFCFLKRGNFFWALVCGNWGFF